MIERFKDTENFREIERTLKDCGLAPGIQVPKEMLDFVSKAIDDGSALPGLLPWANMARALVACRQPDWDRAKSGPTWPSMIKTSLLPPTPWHYWPLPWQATAKATWRLPKRS